MPHGHCYLWQPALVWTMVTSDALIGLAYLSISLTLYSLVRRIRLPYHVLILAFGVFILACGATHWIEIYTLWVPNYWLSAGVKVLTALASVATAVYCFRLFPKIVAVAEAAQAINQTKVRVEEFFFDRISAPPIVKQLLRRILIFPILFSLVILAVGVYESHYVRTIDYWVEHSGEVLKEANSLKLAAGEAITEFMAYRVTGNANLQTASRDYQDKFHEAYRVLNDLMVDNGEQLSKAQEINQHFDHWIQFAKDQQPSKKGDREEAAKLIEEAREYKQNLYSEIESLIESERQLRSSRVVSNRQAESIIFLTVGIYALVMGLFLAFQGRNTIHNLSNSYGLALASERHSREKSEKAIASRDEFLSLASHELRTPLTALKLQLQMVERKTKFDEKHAAQAGPITESMGLALRQIESLVSLVDELLDTSRIQTGQFTLVRHNEDLANIVEEVVAKLSESLRAAGCPVTLDLAPKVIGYWDRRRIEQIIANLLSNSIKYAPRSKIHIKTAKAGSKARLIIEDSGPGIAKDMQAKIFDRFERVHVNDGLGGLGLGLYIVRGIVEAKGGSITVESELQKGTKFIIEIPLVPQEVAKVDHAQT